MHESPKMLLLGLVFFTAIGAVHYYIWFRFVKELHFKPAPSRIVTVFIIIAGVSIPAAMIISRVSGSVEFIRLSAYGPLEWLGSMMLLVFFMVAVDLFRIAAWAVLKLRNIKKTADLKPEPEDPSRRIAVKRLIAGGAVATVAPLSIGASVQGGRRPSVFNENITISRLSDDLDGVTIVQLSDIHLGLTVTGGWLSDVVGQVNSLKPDIIVITGDLVDGTVKLLKSQVAPLQNLKAPMGVFFVTGNHEYYFDAGQWIEYLKTAGIQVLDNRRVKAGTGKHWFYLAGVHDHDASRMSDKFLPDFDKALNGRDMNKPVVLLAHQPVDIYDAAAHGVDLMLSGHTHGGQIWPFNLMVRLRQPYTRGLYRYNSHTQIYVNQGTGLWGPPMRLGTTSEITRIVLRSAAEG